MTRIRLTVGPIGILLLAFLFAGALGLCAGIGTVPTLIVAVSAPLFLALCWLAA